MTTPYQNPFYGTGVSPGLGNAVAKFSVWDGTVGGLVVPLEPLKEQLIYVLGEIAINMEETARGLLQDGGSGIHHFNLPNRSSAPGEPPSNQSGELSRSISGFVVEEEFTAVCYAGTFYSNDLEFGGSKTEARPFMSPMLEEIRADASDLVRGVYRNAAGVR